MAKTKAGKKKVSEGAGGPAPDVVVWNGNVRNPKPAVPNDAIVVRLALVNGVAGGTTGVSVSTNNTVVASCPEWTQYAGLYDEYRVLGFELDWLPYYPGGNNAVVHASGLRIGTHSSDTYVNPTFSVLSSHSNWMPFYTSVSFREQWHMSSEEEGVYLNTSTSTPPLLGTLIAYAPDASSTGRYGLAVATFAVQFRGRK